LKIQPNAWILYHETNKEASTVLCSVLKHLGSGKALKRKEKQSTTSGVLPNASFVLYRFLRALQQNRTDHSRGIQFAIVFHEALEIKESKKIF